MLFFGKYNDVLSVKHVCRAVPCRVVLFKTMDVCHNGPLQRLFQRGQAEVRLERPVEAGEILEPAAGSNGQHRVALFPAKKMDFPCLFPPDDRIVS